MKISWKNGQEKRALHCLSREHCLELVELIELVEMLDTRYLPPSRCRSACCTLLLQCQLLFYHVIPGLSSFPLHILFQLDDIVPVERDNQDVRKILNRRKIKLQKSDSPASHSGMANKFHYCMIRVRAGGGRGAKEAAVPQLRKLWHISGKTHMIPATTLERKHYMTMLLA